MRDSLMETHATLHRLSFNFIIFELNHKYYYKTSDSNYSLPFSYFTLMYFLAFLFIDFMILTPSVLGHVFIFILLIICRFHTGSEIHVGIEIVQSLANYLLTFIESF